MSTTAVPVELAVSVPPGVGHDPEVKNAIEEATNTLIKLLRQHQFPPAERELMWGTSGEPPFQHVVAHLSEADEYGRRQAQRSFSRQRLLDPINRSGQMIWLLLDVRGKRSSQVNDAIDRDITELERQEGLNGDRD
jgi:hypothetical protein